MAFNIAATIDEIETQLTDTSSFSAIVQGRPTSLDTGYTAAILMDRVEVSAVTLTKTIEQHVVLIRIYRDPTEAPTTTVEEDLAERVAQTMADLVADFDLNSTIRNVDAGGQYGRRFTAVDGRRLGATWGYETVAATEYRTVDIAVPLIIDTNATLAE